MVPTQIKQAIADSLNLDRSNFQESATFHPVGGGSINYTYRVISREGTFFLKYNSAAKYPGMFHAEQKGLEWLRQSGNLRIPSVMAVGEDRDYGFLLLEYLNEGPPTADFWDQFGAGLAGMHQFHSANFGLDHNNYIGSIPQRNGLRETWSDFFGQMRLFPLIIESYERGLLDNHHMRSFESLIRKLPTIFPEEKPSLLHGDLWNGNFMTAPEGPVLIDPAVYFGHREMDIGMSLLFGGFSPRFYEAYNDSFPLAPGWRERVDICNLYPLLVHLRLFGKGYLGQIASILQSFA